jgi:hypothetical protein
VAFGVAYCRKADDGTIGRASGGPGQERILGAVSKLLGSKTLTNIGFSMKLSEEIGRKLTVFGTFLEALTDLF